MSEDDWLFTLFVINVAEFLLIIYLVIETWN